MERTVRAGLLSLLTLTVLMRVQGARLSSDITLTERLPNNPYIKEGLPANVTALVNSSATFRCESVSDIKPTMQWTRGFKPDGNNTNSSISEVFQTTSGTYAVVLQLYNVTHEDEGWYGCLVYNNLGNSSASAYLSVVDGQGSHNTTGQGSHNTTEGSHNTTSQGSHNTTEGSHNTTSQGSPPRFTRPDWMLRVIVMPEGGNMILGCSAGGTPLPNITWYKDGLELQRTVGKVRYGPMAIMVMDLVKTDSGNYTCVVSNVFGSINFTFKANIHDRFPLKPHIMEANVTALVNSSATFRCKVESDLDFRLQWIRPSIKPEDNDTNPSGTELLQTFGSSSLDLQLYNVTHEDEGWYTCKASDRLGASVTSAYLKVVDDGGVVGEKKNISHNEVIDQDREKHRHPWHLFDPWV